MPYVWALTLIIVLTLCHLILCFFCVEYNIKKQSLASTLYNALGMSEAHINGLMQER